MENPLFEFVPPDLQLIESSNTNHQARVKKTPPSPVQRVRVEKIHVHEDKYCPKYQSQGQSDFGDVSFQFSVWKCSCK